MHQKYADSSDETDTWLIRSLSWGGASPSVEKLEMRAKRIFGAKLDELQDPLVEEDRVLRTPLQNALIVCFISPCKHP